MGKKKEINLAGSQLLILGLRGGGKTMLAKSILDSCPSHLVYDPLNEYRAYNNHVPADRYSVAELDQFITDRVETERPALLVLEEISRYVPRQGVPPRGVGDLIDVSRHWESDKAPKGLAWICLARRPVQIHPDIRELAHYVACFKLTGRNDIRLLDDWHEGMGQAVRSLDSHQFALLAHGRELTVHAPVKWGNHGRT